MENPTNEEIKFLSKTLDLDKKYLHDALDPFEGPRVEKEKFATYVFTRHASESKEHAHTSPLLIIIHKEYFVTITLEKIGGLDNFFNGMVEFSTTQKTKLLTLLFLQVTTDYQEHINDISREIRNVGTSVEKLTNKEIVKLVNFEKILNDFMAALIPTNITLKNLVSGKQLRLYADDKDLVEDLFLSNNQLVEMCKSNIQYIVTLRETHSTITTNNLNKIMKLLTSVTVILTIPTIIASYYGMNVLLPMQSDPLAWLWIVLGMAVISIILAVVFAFTGLL